MGNFIWLSSGRYGKKTAFKIWAKENPEAYQALIEHLKQWAIEHAQNHTFRVENKRFEWVVTPVMSCPDCENASLPKGMKLAYAKPGLLWGKWASEDAEILPPSTSRPPV